MTTRPPGPGGLVVEGAASLPQGRGFESRCRGFPWLDSAVRGGGAPAGCPGSVHYPLRRCLPSGGTRWVCPRVRGEDEGVEVEEDEVVTQPIITQPFNHQLHLC